MNMGQDLLHFAFGSFFLGLFVSGILSLALAGTTLLDPELSAKSWIQLEDSVSTKAELAQAANVLDNFVKSSENPLAYDIILGMINVGLILLSVITFLIKTLVNYFLLSFWLSQAGTPGAIAGLLVFCWQFVTMYHVSKFVFKGDRVGRSG